MDLSKYKSLFLQETGEHLQEISKELIHLEGEPHNSATLDNLFRHFHSIKGMSASMGYEVMASLSHKLEDILDAIRKKRVAISQEIMDVLLNGSDILQAFTKMVADDKPLDMDISFLLSRINTVLTAKESVPQPSIPSAPIPPFSVQPAAQGLSLPTMIKVDSGIFDGFMGAVGELFTVGSRLKEFTAKSYPVEFHEAVHHLGKTIEGLNQAVITARMIPFDELTQNLPRIVRDMCKKAGKDADLVLHGGDVKLDRAVLEHLTDPLVHIIRNAIDHGIESPEERIQSNKPPKGRITIAVARERDNVIIEITDDGRGIDTNRLKEKAVQSGISKEKIEIMADRELLLLICAPGLSLAKEITETSGRGVGMDVVKGNIESIGGRLEISSQLNKGTKIILELPVTISIIKVLLISISNQLFALPISKVMKVIDVHKSDIRDGSPYPYFVYKDTEIPVIGLRNLLMMPPLEDRDTLPVVIIDAKDKISAIVVDDFEGEMDAYVKPLSRPMVRMNGIIGVTVLGDGRPVFLLDPAALING